MSKKRRQNLLTNILIVLTFVFGLGLSLYPTVSDVYGKYRDSKLMTNYEESVKHLSNNKKENLLNDAIKYNEDLVNNNNGFLITKNQHKEQVEANNKEEVKTYENMLKSSSSSIMGTLSIPSIAVTLPLYHWSSDSVLEKGIGHIHGSSLPVGNGVDPEDPNFSNIVGSHSLFIGHRGLPSLKLFSDLDEVTTGDMFYIKVLDKVYAYKVYATEIVEPTEVENLKIEPGRDLCTLITCTPYGVNTHRILVKGERVLYNGEELEAPIMKKIWKTIDPKTIFGICFIIYIIFLICYLKRRKKRKQKGTKGEHNETKETFSNDIERIDNS